MKNNHILLELNRNNEIWADVSLTNYKVLNRQKNGHGS